MTDATVSPELLTLARRVKDRYVQLKKQRLKNSYALGTRHNKIQFWVEAAKLAKKLNVTPEALVEACFDGDSRPGGPFPNNLAGPAAQRWVAQWKLKVNFVEENNPGAAVFAEAGSDFVESLKLCLQIASARFPGVPASNDDAAQYLIDRGHDFMPAALAVAVYPNNKLPANIAKKALEYFQLRPEIKIPKQIKHDFFEWLEQKASC